MIIEPFDTLQREWPTIKAAPWSFCVAVAVLVGVAWAVINWLYKARLGHLKETVGRQKEEIERLSTPTAPTSVPISQSKKARPLVECLEIRRDSFLPNERGGYCETSANSSAAARGLMLVLYYNPASEVRSDLYVKAHIVLVDKESRKRTIVPAACWVGEPENRIVFQCGDTKSVLLVLRAKDGKFVTIENSKESVAYFPSDEDPLDSLSLIDVSDEDKSVEVTLMEVEGGYKQTFPFEIRELKSKLASA